MSAGSRALNSAFIIGGGILGFVVGLVIYRRTMARAAELALEEGEGPGPAAALAAAAGLDDDGSEFADGPSEEGRLMQDIDMMDPDAAALAMDDDDISLWETDGVEGGAYRDSWDEEGATDKKTSG